jgi:hypothetical protein
MGGGIRVRARVTLLSTAEGGKARAVSRLYSPHEAFFTSHPHRRAPSFRPFICLIGYRGNSQCNAFGINLPSSAGSEGRAAPPFTERMA